MFSLANPFALGFWAGVGGGLAAAGATHPQAGSFLLLFGGFVLGALLWNTLHAVFEHPAAVVPFAGRALIAHDDAAAA